MAQVSKPQTPQTPRTRLQSRSATPQSNKRPREEYQYGQFKSITRGHDKSLHVDTLNPGKNEIFPNDYAVLSSVLENTRPPSRSCTVEMETGTPENPQTTVFRATKEGWERTISLEAHNTHVVDVDCSSWSQVFETVSKCGIEACELVFKEKEKQAAGLSNQLDNSKEELEAVESYISRGLLHQMADKISNKLLLKNEIEHLKQTQQACRTSYEGQSKELESAQSEKRRVEDEIETLKTSRNDRMKELGSIKKDLIKVFPNRDDRIRTILHLVQGKVTEGGLFVSEQDHTVPLFVNELNSRTRELMKDKGKLMNAKTEKVEELFTLRGSEQYANKQLSRLKTQKQDREKWFKGEQFAERKSEFSSTLARVKSERLAGTIQRCTDKRDLIQGVGLMKLQNHIRDSKRTIYGLVRSHIEFSPNATEAQKLMILFYLKDELTTFLVNEGDKNYWEARKAQYDAFDVKFESRVLALKPGEFQGDGNTPSVLDLLIINEDEVKNYLIWKKHIDVTGVSPLRFRPARGDFFNPATHEVVSSSSHINGSILIVTEDYCCVRTYASLNEEQFKKKAEWLDFGALEDFEDKIGKMTTIQTGIPLLEEEIRLQESEYNIRHHNVATAQKKLCQTVEQLDRVSWSLVAIDKLESPCLELHKQLKELKQSEDSVSEKLKSLRDLEKKLGQKVNKLKTEYWKVTADIELKNKTLKSWEDDDELTKAEEEHDKYKAQLDEFKKSHPNVDLRVRASKESKESIKTKLREITEKIAQHKKQVLHDAVHEYLLQLGVSVDVSQFNKEVATVAISRAIDQMRSPTVFVSGDIEIQSQKQLLIVAEHYVRIV